jgi:hypothetical protein
MEQKNWGVLEKEDRFILQVCQANEKEAGTIIIKLLTLLKVALNTWRNLIKGLKYD